MNSDGSNSDGNNYDLTTMIKDKKTLLISDFEGTTPTAHFNKFKEYCSGDDNKQVLFLGDVFDNTAQFSKNCNGTSCENPDEISDCPTDENYCALQTIKLLVDNEKSCKYVFGNRDINKIKLLPFFSFKSKSNWWTNGKSYDEIVNNFFTTVEKPETRWLIQPDNYKYFQPFWNKKKYAETKSNWGDTGEKNYINTESNDIYDRFVMMFGADPKHGTMSALVTLKCIPNELLNGIDGGIEDFYLKITSIDESVDDAIKKKRIRAALTITIFMRMLDKELWTGIKKETPHTAFGGLDGYLYNYLTKAPAAYYAESRENLLLFAHGGITNNFINASGNLDIDDIINRDMDGIVGGDGHGNIIKTKINNYNNVYFTTLNNFFNKRGENSVGDIYVGGGDYPVLNRLGENPKFNDPNINDELEKTQFENKQLKNMLVLLSISAGIKENPNQKKEPSDNNLDEYVAQAKYTKIYNIFGHASSSAGYSLSKVKGSEKTYYINTDFSTTLYKQGIPCDENYNSNYLIAVLNTMNDKFEITVDGRVIIDTNKIRIEQNEQNEQTEFSFDGTKDLLNELDKIQKPPGFDFNGIMTNDGTSYYVFSSIYRSAEKDKKDKIIRFVKISTDNNTPSTGNGGNRQIKHKQNKPIKINQSTRKTARKQRKTTRKQRKTARKQRKTARKQRKTTRKQRKTTRKQRKTTRKQRKTTRK